MNDRPSQPPNPLTPELLDYWTKHPEAQWTIEAIVEWALLEQQIRKAVADVRSALADLVARDFVTERRQADGRIFYLLNKEKAAEIGAWIGLHRPTDGRQV